VKQDRDDDDVRRCLDRLVTEAADPTINLMPALIEAAASRVTVGESTSALESVFGTWFERPFV
jgi:methylmalonyl-CoA mutase, N-terminal domain